MVDRRTINLSLFRITRNPLWFGKLQWAGPELIDDTITGLLPPKAMPISYEDLDFMHRAFEKGDIEGISWQRADT